MHVLMGQKSMVYFQLTHTCSSSWWLTNIFWCLCDLLHVFSMSEGNGVYCFYKMIVTIVIVSIVFNKVIQVCFLFLLIWSMISNHYYNLKHEFMAINTINHRFLTNQKLKCVLTHLFQSMSNQPKINAGFNIVCQHLRYFLLFYHYKSLFFFHQVTIVH